jgi:hypothetical protein
MERGDWRGEGKEASQFFATCNKRFWVKDVG